MKREQQIVCMHAQSCPTLCDPRDCSPSGLSVHGDSLVKNIGVGCHALLQWIFLIQDQTRFLNPFNWQFTQTSDLTFFFTFSLKFFLSNDLFYFQKLQLNPYIHLGLSGYYIPVWYGKFKNLLDLDKRVSYVV